MIIRYINKLSIYSILTISICSGCSQNPVTGKKEFAILSETDEISLGKEAYSSMTQAEGGPFTSDKNLVAYINKIGSNIAKQSDRPQLPYEFTIINSETPNAWALPGGKIAINRGLLEHLSSEAELAAVLSHEVVHAAARHSAKAVEKSLLLKTGLVAMGVALKESKYNDIILKASSAAVALMQLKYSRAHEIEADRYGMTYMQKAGYDPIAAVRLQEMFVRIYNEGKEGSLTRLFATHPPSAIRVQENKKTVEQLPKGGFIGKDEYQAKIALLLEKKPAYDTYKKGVHALKKSDYQLALSYADQATHTYPNEALFWLLKGQSHLALEQNAQAEYALDQAINHNQELASAYLERAKLYFKMNRYSVALYDAQKSASLLPTSEANLLMGKIYIHKNQKDLAYKHLQIATYAPTEHGKEAKALIHNLNLKQNM